MSAAPTAAPRGGDSSDPGRSSRPGLTPRPPSSTPPRGSSRAARPRLSARRRETLAGWMFISPWILGFLVFTGGAMVMAAGLAFSDLNLATGQARWVGGDNFARLIDDPRVARSLGNTLFYAVLSVPLELAVALGLASLLARVGRGSAIFRTLFYLPKMTPMVATAAIFFLLLNGSQGAINQGLRAIGIQGPQWLVDPAWIKPSIVLMSLWAVSGTMVIFLAALKSVPRELYEVAAIDGAGAIRRFWNITLPMISPALFFNTIVLTIAAFQTFDQAYLLFYRDQSNAAPEASLFYAVYLFQQAFRQFNLGFAAAMAWVLFVIIMIVTAIQVRLGNRFVHYSGRD